jgi:hypothetical protein
MCPKREMLANLNKLKLRKGVRGYEASISQIRRQKINLKSRQDILLVIKQYLR